MSGADRPEKGRDFPYVSQIIGKALRDLTEKRLLELVKAGPVPGTWRSSWTATDGLPNNAGSG